ncbi:hypothetical protein, partial [Hyphococcus sp.]|uniref:hypothetical protein n=1 Tax=Hyphococcus sp. TaxID=2038636 RepID=UPI003752A27B
MTAVIEKVTIDCGHDRQATLYLGDSYLIIPDVTDADDWRLDDVACVMDPPYKFDTSGGGKLRKTRKNMDEIEAEGLNEGFDVSILDTGDGHWCASAVVFCHNDQLAELMPALDARFHRLALLAWRKINPMPVANKAYVPELEPYLHGWNPGAHPVGALRDLRRIWDGPVGVNEFDHPTQKPIN